MTDIVQLSCPSCGSKLSPADNTNHFACDSCGNIFMFKQTGASISLLPIATSSPNVVGNSNVVVRISNVIPSITTASEQVPTALPITENVECPICGRLNARIDTFRCKNCQRSFLCLSHQDKESFLCNDCITNTATQSKEQNSSVIGSIILPTLIICTLFTSIFIMFFDIDQPGDMQWVFYSTPFGIATGITSYVLRSRKGKIKDFVVATFWSYIIALVVRILIGLIFGNGFYL